MRWDYSENGSKCNLWALAGWDEVGLTRKRPVNAIYRH